MKRIVILFLASLTMARADFYNIDTHERAEKLPKAIKVNGNVILDPSLKEASLVGWREVPEIKAEAGTKIVAVELVQDTKDPLKVKPVVTTKTDAQEADEKAQAEQAAQTAREEYEAARQKARDEITKPFADKEQAEAIGKLFDLRWVP